MNHFVMLSMLLILFTLFHFSDIKIRLSRNKALGTDQEINEVCGHKFVLATRNESWGRADLDTLGKSCVTFHMLTTGIKHKPYSYFHADAS